MTATEISCELSTYRHRPAEFQLFLTSNWNFGECFEPGLHRNPQSRPGAVPHKTLGELRLSWDNTPLLA